MDFDMASNNITFYNSINNTGFLFNAICLMETWYNNFQMNNNFNTVFQRTQNEKMKSIINDKFNPINLNDDKDSNINFSRKVFEQIFVHILSRSLHDFAKTAWQ